MPVSISYTRAVESIDAVTRSVDNGLNSDATTSAVCPWNVCKQMPFEAAHNFDVLSNEVVEILSLLNICLNCLRRLLIILIFQSISFRFTKPDNCIEPQIRHFYGLVVRVIPLQFQRPIIGQFYRNFLRHNCFFHYISVFLSIFIGEFYLLPSLLNATFVSGNKFVFNVLK